MQMHIPHSLVVLVVSLGIFAQAKPTAVPKGGCTEKIEVPIEVAKTCPKPEIANIETVFKSVKEVVPNSGCTDDFTDFANVQRIADLACKNGLVFSPEKSRKRGIFERSPACQSFSIVENRHVLRRRDEPGSLSDKIHFKFDSVSKDFKHHVDQNINNNANTKFDDEQFGGSGFGFGGLRKVKRNPSGLGKSHGDDGGDFDDNNNQNINQNVNAKQDLMANIHKFNSFFSEGHHKGHFDGEGHKHGGFGLGFGINDNTDFNVNNNVAFEDEGFFKDKRALRKRDFGKEKPKAGHDDDDFDDDEDQSINQNINFQQHINERFFHDVLKGYGDDLDGGHHGVDDHYPEGFYGGFVPFIPGFDGFKDFKGFEDDDFEDKSVNENVNINPNVNIDEVEHDHHKHHGHHGHGFGGKMVKRSKYDKFDDKYESANVNKNHNTNVNHNKNTEFETITEKAPIVGTVHKPEVEHKPIEIIEAVPVIEEVHKPVHHEKVKKIKHEPHKSLHHKKPVIPQIKAAVIEEKFNFVDTQSKFHVHEHKKEDPKKEDPKKEDPKKDDPKKEDPKKDDPKKDDFKKDDPKKEDFKKDFKNGLKKIDYKKEDYKKDEPKKVAQPVHTAQEIEVAQPVQVAQPVKVDEDVAVKADPFVEVNQPIEIIAPVAVEIQPIIEYSAVFYEAPGCGIPEHPSYSYGSCPY